MHFSTGSKMSCKISKFETVSLKKLFSSLAISWSFSPTYFSQLVLGLVQGFLYSREV